MTRFSSYEEGLKTMRRARNAVVALELLDSGLSKISEDLESGVLEYGDQLATRLNDLHAKVHIPACPCPLGQLTVDDYKFRLVGTQGNHRTTCSWESTPCRDDKNGSCPDLEESCFIPKNVLCTQKLPAASEVSKSVGGGKNKGKKRLHKFGK